MTKSSNPAPSAASRWLWPAAGLAVVAVAVIAFVLSQGSGAKAAPSPASSAAPSVVSSPTSTIAEPSGAAPSSAPSATATGSNAAVGEPTITGTPLPTFTGGTPDPAVGLAAPVVNGSDFAGAPVAIAPSGKTTVVIFAAHWCPHCQREIPVIQAWVDAGGLTADVDMITVSTAIDSTLPNYPPKDWFAREHWTAPVLVDPTNTVAAAYGLAGYPYFVILDGAGNVFARLAGEIPMSQLEQVLATVPRA